MRNLVVILFILLSFVTCKKEGETTTPNSKTPSTNDTTIISGDTINTDTLPNCVMDKIDAIKTEAVRNPAGSVWEYTYNGKTVYFIPQYCCDIFSELYDTTCTLICYPDGGIAGSGDGKCSDFFTTRTNEKLIWQDPR